MPTVLGENEKLAMVDLSRNGLGFAVTPTTACAAGQNGTVTSQNPPAGAQVSRGSSVDITVCTYSPATVPNVVGLPESQAVAAVDDAGLTADTQTLSTCPSGQSGTVASQKPAGGQPIPANPLVVIYVCP